MKKTLSNSEIRNLNKDLESYGFALSKKERVEVLEHEKARLLLVANRPLLFFYEDKLVPTLRLVLAQDIRIKKVVVDMGAVKFVVSGADIMRPGIREIEQGFAQGDAVLVVDETHRKPLALGIALFSSEEMQALGSGKVVKNVHYVGDWLWGLFESKQ